MGYIIPYHRNQRAEQPWVARDMLNAPLAKILEFKRDLAEEVFRRIHRARRSDSAPRV